MTGEHWADECSDFECLELDRSGCAAFDLVEIDILDQLPTYQALLAELRSEAADEAKALDAINNGRQGAEGDIAKMKNEVNTQ